MTRQLIGEVGVDSGSIMIIDPCYLNDTGRWKPAKMLEMATKFEAENNFHMANNSRRLAKEKTELQNISSNWDQYCKDSQEADYKPREYGSGIISPTRNGDGGFPVYATYDKDGRVKKLEIVF